MCSQEIKYHESFGIATLTTELNKCVRLLKRALQCKQMSQLEGIIKMSRYHLCYCIGCIKANKESVLKQDLKRNILLAEIEAEEQKVRLDHIRNEWIQQQQTLAELQECFFHKCRLLTLHNSYYSIQGNCFCSIICSLLDEDEATNTFLEEVEFVIGFVKISQEFLCTIAGAYSSDPLVEDSSDYKFVMYLFTCLVKITTCERGCALLTKNEACCNFVCGIIHAMKSINHEIFVNLKILIWMFIHNLSKENNGIILLQRCNSLLGRIGDCLEEPYKPKLFKYVFEVLEKLSTDIPNKRYLENIEQSINVRTLKGFSHHQYKEVFSIPMRVLRNIGQAAKIFVEGFDVAKPKVLKVGNDLSSIKTGFKKCVYYRNKTKQKRKRTKKYVSDSPSSHPTSNIVLPLLSNWTRRRSFVCTLPVINSIMPIQSETSNTSIQLDGESLKSVMCLSEKATILNSKSEEVELDSITLESSKNAEEKMLIPWTSPNSIIPYVSERNRLLPTTKIINRLINVPLGKTQKVTNRIVIPGVSFSKK
ncbi:hypothetical protein FQA39_LY12645 [Lamprigera yunnana]|nr:hypothetical protein FQA39_LY12645 [Lamprigera yunnana]